MFHVVVSISGHGFGHVAQTAPVLNLLYRKLPQVRLTIRSSASLAHLHSRLNVPFTHLPSEGDIGMIMSSALDVSLERSQEAYDIFHKQWDARIDQESRLIRKLNADLVLSNVGYLPLAGAQRAKVPNLALGSLNWADIYHHYFGDDTVYREMLSSYMNTDAFLRLSPGMPMNNLPNLIPVAPIGAAGTNRRNELKQRLRLSDSDRLVLVSLGGVSSRLPIECWPRAKGVRWLVQNSWHVEHPDAVPIESLPMSFPDVLASSDLLICKPGYGSFVEAACSRVPVLYVCRDDWPETAALVTWMQRNGICGEIARDALQVGNIMDSVEQIWSSGRPNAIHAAGTRQVAERLAMKLAQQVDPTQNTSPWPTTSGEP